VKEIDDGGAAFPHLNPDFDGNWNNNPQRGGMTLRDYFASAANEEDICNMREKYKKAVPDTDAGDGYGPDYKYPSRTKCRYLHADEMLAARKEVLP
jgi:hypothetical protein